MNVTYCKEHDTRMLFTIVVAVIILIHEIISWIEVITDLIQIGLFIE